MSADIKVSNHGTIFLFVPMSPEGRIWIQDHVDDPMWHGGGIAVGHRFARPLAGRMIEAGLTVV